LASFGRKKSVSVDSTKRTYLSDGNGTTAMIEKKWL
jgi:hypothetical protein